MQTQIGKMANWSIEGIVVLGVVPFALWGFFVFGSELVIAMLGQPAAFMLRALALLAVVSGVGRLIRGPTNKTPKRFLRELHEQELNAEAAVTQMTSESPIQDNNDAAIEPKLSPENVTQRIAKHLEGVRFDVMTDEQKTLAEARVYIDYGRLAQALAFLQQIPAPSAFTNEVIDCLQKKLKG